MDHKDLPFKGTTLVSIDINDDNDEIIFESDTGQRWKMYHKYICCETVKIEDFIGDANDLIGAPLLEAEEVEEVEDPGPKGKDFYGCDLDEDEYLWTFYKLSTIKGTVTIRWYGSSNGHYSMAVTIKEL